MVRGVRRTPVYLEVGSRRVFACSLDWPGWCRAGKDEESALAALVRYVPRYRVVTDEAGQRFVREDVEPVVRERVQGNATTDFGAPGVVPAADSAPWTAHEGRRQAGLVAAAWEVLDRVAAGAPEQLRKGPRGGGRDRDQVVAHVVDAERSYARTIGVRHPPLHGDPAALAALRADLLAVLRRPSPGEVTSGWPVRYAARRIAWHALDHAWEIEDKS